MNEYRIKSIVKSLANINSANFFHDICLSLSKAINADFVYIASLDDNDTLATTIALASQGKIIENISYSLPNTPCEQIVNSLICTHRCNIQQRYPNDARLIDMSIEGYVGVPLKNVEGNIAAILVALFQEPISNTNEIETLFLLFSGFIERELHKKSYSEKLELTNTIIENSHEAILITDAHTRIIHTNKAFSKITGYHIDEVTGETPKFFQSGHHDKHFYQKMWSQLKRRGHWQGEIWNKRKSGEIYPEWLSISTIYNKVNQVTHYVSFFSDITQQNKDKSKIKRQYYFDSLTKLANKKMLFQQVDQAIKQNCQEPQNIQSLCGLLVMDLDLFKHINNTYGHAFGDKLLRLVANRLKSLIRATDTVARTSGDSFALFIKNLPDEQGAQRIAENIKKSFSDPFHLDGITTSCSLSIGIALFPHDEKNAAGLFKKAEQAMFDAKDNGRNSFRFFTSNMEESAARILKVKSELEEAINSNKLDVVFQPIISLKTQLCTKFEALVRWNNNGTWVSPTDFIPIAEHFNLIDKIGDIVLKKSCQVLKTLKNAGFTDIIFNINRSIYEFPIDEANNNLWLNVIEASGLSPSDICFELTESVLAPENGNNISLLKSIQDAGCKIALDDFGTGYSSLSYLRRFSIDILKIDRSFIKEMTMVKDDKTLVTAIITMAKALGIAVVAEGVEKKEEVEILTELGCDFIQGYYFSKPLPVQALEIFLKKFSFTHPLT
ncbi:MULTISPECIES: putative bifunctional diguanylate cyclase/phosphodiesterase [unclassified Colwellia]|uniref:putative bifunctional diguanylate cyclase/phosphodiesterase n=1 Tax=unclassified Colwellia TaxID=196834 RepID=UPI0015F45307|nr:MULTISPECIES: EAL domain-containing protein [unclassified Colwellia]MBA6233532.1 EAL domain-containing protein [Colwellia sp. MB02u-7]MBA6238092.1 EAL domain-containing protein [Colwellia sp. MB02u-11]MBA6257321.1 EAL domain-containing protein [Colwellia sp. MB3u-28]MBA6258905.1 EAL domain-containing protein [Colwellia sp. MB3u-41]MBA6299771.1 EAL domain-containing protein [Colwellia sp. MB3u-22]